MALFIKPQRIQFILSMMIGLVRPRVTMLAQNAGMRDKEIRTLQWDGFVYDELVELIYKHSR